MTLYPSTSINGGGTRRHSSSSRISLGAIRERCGTQAAPPSAPCCLLLNQLLRVGQQARQFQCALQAAAGELPGAVEQVLAAKAADAQAQGIARLQLGTDGGQFGAGSALERGDLIAQYFTLAIGALDHQGGKQGWQPFGVFQVQARHANQGAGLLHLLQGDKPCRLQQAAAAWANRGGGQFQRCTDDGRICPPCMPSRRTSCRPCCRQSQISRPWLSGNRVSRMP